MAHLVVPQEFTPRLPTLEPTLLEKSSTVSPKMTLVTLVRHIPTEIFLQNTVPFADLFLIFSSFVCLICTATIADNVGDNVGDVAGTNKEYMFLCVGVCFVRLLGSYETFESSQVWEVIFSDRLPNLRALLW